MTSHNANFRPDDGTTMCNLDGDDHIDYDDREEEEVAETPEVSSWSPLGRKSNGIIIICIGTF